MRKIYKYGHNSAQKLILTKTSLLLAGTAHAKQLDFVEVRLFAASLISDQITHQF